MVGVSNIYTPSPFLIDKQGVGSMAISWPIGWYSFYTMVPLFSRTSLPAISRPICSHYPRPVILCASKLSSPNSFLLVPVIRCRTRPILLEVSVPPETGSPRKCVGSPPPPPRAPPSRSTYPAKFSNQQVASYSLSISEKSSLLSKAWTNPIESTSSLGTTTHE